MRSGRHPLTGEDQEEVEEVEPSELPTQVAEVERSQPLVQETWDLQEIRQRPSGQRGCEEQEEEGESQS